MGSKRSTGASSSVNHDGATQPQTTRPVVRVHVVPQDGAGSAGTPEPPAGYIELRSGEARRLNKVNAAQAACLGGMIAEFSQGGGYDTDFPAHVPPREDLRARAETTQRWVQEEARARAWFNYVSDQRQRAADALVEATNSLEDVFAAAVAHQPSLAERYPSTARFFAVKHEMAVRAAATRKRANKNEAPAPPQQQGAATATQGNPNNEPNR